MAAAAMAAVVMAEGRGKGGGGDGGVGDGRGGYGDFGTTRERIEVGAEEAGVVVEHCAGGGTVLDEGELVRGTKVGEGAHAASGGSVGVADFWLAHRVTAWSSRPIANSDPPPR
eukprot:scaffold15137_cov129-Isochrysis_galbana.AAC.4